jgi:hypothetical protein
LRIGGECSLPGPREMLSIMKVRGVRRIIISVAERQRSLALYRDVLGADGEVQRRRHDDAGHPR